MLSGANTLGQSGPWSNDNEGVLCILQISKAGYSPSDGLMSYLGISLGGSYLSAEMQAVYSTAPANWAFGFLEAEGNMSSSLTRILFFVLISLLL